MLYPVELRAQNLALTYVNTRPIATAVFRRVARNSHPVANSSSSAPGQQARLTIYVSERRQIAGPVSARSSASAHYNMLAKQ